tara:strand:- start:164 stop:1291 length:1128 start_codon:yes stop_codon:yes gene_type:complete
MAVPGTGSTNQAMTITAFKRLLGKANTSALKEFYEETIPSNVQINSSTIFGQAIPQTVSTTSLYAQFSASLGAAAVVEFVEFHVESISGTTYDADTGTFGDVGFGAGDEAQSSGPHAYQLSLTSSYVTLSSNSSKGSGFFVNDQVIHQANGGLQLIPPSFGPQSGNNYALELYTAHPDNGGSRIFPTDPIDWQIDYFNGIVFIQDYLSTKIPTYARGFIYTGKYADEVITDSGESGGGVVSSVSNGVDNRIATFTGANSLNGEANLTFNSNVLTINAGVVNKRNAISSTMTASVSDYIIGVSAGSSIVVQLPNASTLGNGQTYIIKDEAGTAPTYPIEVKAATGQTIDGQASVYLESPYSSINLYCNGTDKFFIF